MPCAADRIQTRTLVVQKFYRGGDEGKVVMLPNAHLNVKETYGTLSHDAPPYTHPKDAEVDSLMVIILGLPLIFTWEGRHLMEIEYPPQMRQQAAAQ